MRHDRHMIVIDMGQRESSQKLMRLDLRPLIQMIETPINYAGKHQDTFTKRDLMPLSRYQTY